MTAITFVINAAVLNVLWIRVVMSALIGLGRRWTSFTRQFEDLSSFLRTSFNQLSQDVTAKIASNNASFTVPPEVSVADRPLGQQPSPLPTVATVGHHREFQVQGGVDREPPMTIHPPSQW